MIRLDAKAYVENMKSTSPSQFDYRCVQEGTDSWDQWQQRFRQALSDLSGLSAMRKLYHDLPLSPRVVEVEETERWTLEKIYIQAEPNIEIPFYLMLPKHVTGPVPLVLCPHGHGRRGKEIYVGRYDNEEEKAESEAGERDIALQAVHMGFGVIAPDVRGFWEMATPKGQEERNSCRELQRRSLMSGRTLIGERVYDMGRLIDYAATRPEFDLSRIMITGNSGGGTVSLFTAALDTRISLTAPGSYFCTFADSIMSINHCECNIIPGILKLGEMYDVAGLIAPRPILVIHGIQDRIFPIEGTREAFQHLCNIYRAFEAEKHCELYEGEGGHRYYKARVWSFAKQYLG